MDGVASTISGRDFSFVGKDGVGDIGGNNKVLVSDGGVQDDDFIIIRGKGIV